MTCLNIMGNEIFFAEKGLSKKEAVVFVHGAGCNHKVWLSQLENISENYRVIAVDLPGHGYSKGSSLQSIEDYTQFIKAFKRQLLDGKKFFLAGHSMGGAITLQYALDYPDDLKGIILVATGSRLRVNKTILETYKNGEHYEQLINYAVDKNASEEIKSRVQEIKKDSPPAVCYNDYTACDNFDVSGRLSEICIPTLVVCGTGDMLTPLKYSEYLSRNINGSILKIIEDSGHFISIEKPDLLNEVIVNFLSELQEE